MKIGIITNHYDVGGGGQHCIYQVWDALLDHEITGIAVLNHRDNLITNSDILSGDLKSSIKYLNEVSDIIIHWADLGDIEFKKPVIFITMGASSWTENAYNKYKKYIKYRVSLSEVAGKFFIEPYSLIYPYIQEEKLEGERLDYGDNVIGYIGRISHEKGLEETLELVKESGWTFVLGFNPINTQWENYFLEKLEKEIPGQYRLYNPDYNVGPLLKSFTVTSVLSPSEGFCLTAAESLACGIPTLTNRTGFMAEVELPDYHYAGPNMVDRLYKLKEEKNNNQKLYKDIASRFNREDHNKKWNNLIKEIEFEIYKKT